MLSASCSPGLAFFPSSGILAAAVFGSGAVLALLFAGSLGWKILELKEKHIYRMLYVILPSLIITGIFVLIFLITFIQQWLRGPKLSEQLAETRAEIEETLDSYGEGMDADDKVYVYQFEEDGGLYDYISSFSSDAISRADVEGKEDGIIPAGSE